MELKEFITATLVEIAEGIKNAQVEYEKLGGVVNPSNLYYKDGVYSPGTNPSHSTDRYYSLSTVEFEVGLTAISNAEEKAGIGVFLNVIGAGTATKDSSSDAVVTKVKFQIQVKLPTTRLKV